MSNQYYTYIKSQDAETVTVEDQTRHYPATWTVWKIAKDPEFGPGRSLYAVEDFENESLAKELVEDLNSGERVYVHFKEEELNSNGEPSWVSEDGKYTVSRVPGSHWDNTASHYALYWISGYPIKCFAEHEDAMEFAQEHANDRKLSNGIRP